ncbi:MAG: hypothetical protein ABSA68_02560 [Xanthobacteraceae bacterium]
MLMRFRDEHGGRRRQQHVATGTADTACVDVRDAIVIEFFADDVLGCGNLCERISEEILQTARWRALHSGLGKRVTVHQFEVVEGQAPPLSTFRVDVDRGDA